MEYEVEAGTLSRVAEKTLVAIEVEQAAIQGHIEFNWLHDSTTGKDYSESDLPVELPLGNEVFAIVSFYNDSSSTQSLTCRAEFIDPDGISRGRSTMWMFFGAGAAFPLPTYSVNLDKAGLWKIHATLETTP